MKSILYITDDPAFSDALKSRLEESGKYRVDTVSSAKTGQAMLQQTRYDAVVAGYGMPDMDGITLLKAVRAAHPDLAFIICTGNGGEDTVINAYENGADAYVRIGEDRSGALDILTKKIGEAARPDGRIRYGDDTIFRSLIHHLKTPVIIISPDGKVLFSNPAARNLVGMGESDQERVPHISQVLDQDTFRKVMAKLRAIPVGPSSSLDEYPVATKQGETRWVEGASTWITFRGEDAVLVTLHDRTRRRQHEQEIIRMQTFLQDIIDAIPEPVFVKDREHRWVVINTAACQVVGRPRDQLLGRSDREFFPEKEARVFYERDDKVLMTGDDDENEQYLTDTQGNRHTVLTKKRRITGPAGEQYILGVSRDITQWRQMEAELRESREQYRSVVEDQTELISRSTTDGTITFVNEAFCRYFNRKNEDIIGTPFKPAMSEEDMHGMNELLSHLDAANPVRSIECRTLMPDGDIRWLRWIVRALIDPSGHVSGFQSVGRDMTEQVTAIRALQESEERYHSLFDNMIGGSALHEILFDEHGVTVDFRFLDINRGYEQIFGVRRDDVIGKTCSEVFGKNASPPLDVFSRVERTGIPETFELYFPPTKRHLHISAYSPAKTLVATVMMDITRRKRSEDALHLANTKLNLMSRITRHDILNRILVLRGLLDLSRDYLRDPQNMKACIEKEEQVVQQIQQQITFTRDYQDLGIVEPVWQRVRELIRTVVDTLPMGTVAVEVTCADREIFADRLLERVFYNLLENALRHGGMQMTTVRISSHDTGTGMTLVVEDDGIGIAKEDKIHLFAQESLGQHGLGLFLSREILSITGITITENGTPGKGARFEMMVPESVYRDIPDSPGS